MLKVRTDSRFLFILFLIWPFGSFLLALGRNALFNYRSIILLFSFIFGYTVYLYSGDILEYEKSYREILKYSWGDYWFLITHVLSIDKLNDYVPNVVNTQPDIYALSMQFVTSRLTENPRWFWAFVSLFYTFIFLRFIKDVYAEIDWKEKAFPQKVFFAFLILMVPFYVGVTGVRFWTALFVFMTFSLKYVKSHRSKYIFLASTSILIHFSFLVPFITLLLYRYLKMSRWMVTALILISAGFFAVSSNNEILEIIQSNTGFFEETSVEDRVEGYSNSELLMQKKAIAAGRNWYINLHQNSLLYVLIFTFLLEFAGFFKWNSNAFLKNLYPLIVIFFCLTLLTFNLGSLGRFRYVFYLLSLVYYAVLYGINPGNRALRILSYILIPLLVLHIAVSARAGFYYVDPLLLVSNPILLFFVQSDVSLSELIVGH
jgi:hypothetical protein